MVRKNKTGIDWSNKEARYKYQNEWRKKNSEKIKIINKKYYKKIRLLYRKGLNKKQVEYYHKHKKLKCHYSIKKNCAVQTPTRFIIINEWKNKHGCGICHIKENLEIHHWLYKMPVQRKHFSILCNSCHEITHRRQRN